MRKIAAAVSIRHQKSEKNNVAVSTRAAAAYDFVPIQ
jgi:hypothetical protein